MKPHQQTRALAIAMATPEPTRPRTLLRQQRRRQQAHRLAARLFMIVGVACLLLTYLFGCVLMAQCHYRVLACRERLERLQEEHRRLEGQIPVLLRQERIQQLAAQQGMRPPEARQYVQLPQSANAMRLASAR